MFDFMKSLISILLLVGIENLAPTRAASLDRNHHNLVRLTRRRMNQEANLKSPVTEPCDGRICATVAGKVIGARLAAAPNCARQDIADQLITDAKTNPLVKGDKLREQLIQWAKLICESEQNTHPDYQKNPQTQRNFLYCLKAPKNAELNDCIPKQFEGNDPNIFFTPKEGSVALGSRPDTFPRQKQKSGGSTTQKQNTTTTDTSTPQPKKDDTKKDDTKKDDTKKDDTKKDDTKKDDTKKDDTKKDDAKKDDTKKDDTKKDDTKKENTDQGGKTGAVDASKGKVVDASTLPEKCNNPKANYAGGVNGRKATEMTYQPVDTKFFAHGEALNFQIITSALCDKILQCLKEAKKKEDEVQKVFKSCKDVSKAIGTIKKSGLAADQWNAAFGISSDFKSKDGK